MKETTLIVLGCALLVIVSFAIVGFQMSSRTITNQDEIEKEEVLSEINRLLLPVSAQTITALDLETLKKMVASEEHASEKVRELEVLARYQEYSHIGHGLGELHRYLQTGKERVCPGHYLAHYYVFSKHGENSLAEENLHEAEEKIDNLSSSLFIDTLSRIRAGNSTASEYEISDLADAECI
ncbi:MAG: hypothetical protein AABY00_04235 [Nanoarchaeota archaeon]